MPVEGPDRDLPGDLIVNVVVLTIQGIEFSDEISGFIVGKSDAPGEFAVPGFNYFSGSSVQKARGESISREDSAIFKSFDGVSLLIVVNEGLELVGLS
jgi:hypothetical protein